MLSDDRLNELKRALAENPIGSVACCDVIDALTELQEARRLLRDALPHLHHTGATHHQQCACSVKRRIEAAVKSLEDAK